MIQFRSNTNIYTNMEALQNSMRVYIFLRNFFLPVSVPVAISRTQTVKYKIIIRVNVEILSISNIERKSLIQEDGMEEIFNWKPPIKCDCLCVCEIEQPCRLHVCKLLIVALFHRSIGLVSHSN